MPLPSSRRACHKGTTHRGTRYRHRNRGIVGSGSGQRRPPPAFPRSRACGEPRPAPVAATMHWRTGTRGAAKMARPPAAANTPTACSSRTPSERHRLTGLFSTPIAPGPSDIPSKTANDFYTSLTKCAKPEISGLFTAIISMRLAVAPAVTEPSATRRSTKPHGGRITVPLPAASPFSERHTRPLGRLPVAAPGSQQRLRKRRGT